MRILYYFLLVASVALLVLSRMEHSVIHTLKRHIADVMTPIVQSALVAVDPMRRAKRRIDLNLQLSAELERMRDQNARLRNWEWRAKELQRRLEALNKLTRVVEERAVPFVTARVVAQARGAFGEGLLVGAGRDHNLRPGLPVVSGKGLVGCVADTGRRAARVTLISDDGSRIAVRVSRTGVRGQLVGDGSPMPRLDAVMVGARIAPGDDVATSGAGGLLPEGLRVGTVTKDANGVLRVRPVADGEDAEYLSVLLYSGPAQERLTKTRGISDGLRLTGTGSEAPGPVASGGQ